MTWSEELPRFALHAAVAAAVSVALAALSRPGRPLARVVAAIGAWSPAKALFIVLCAAFAVRAALVCAFDPVFEADIKEYVNKAALLADGESLRTQEETAPGRFFYRPLGYSLALSGWFRVTGTRGLESACWFGALLGTAVAWLVLRLGRALGREGEGRIAALTYALFLPAAQFSVLPYTEAFVTVLVLAMSLCVATIRSGAGVGAAAVLGVAAGWTAVTRTELAFMLPLAWCFTIRPKVRGWATSAALVAVSAVGFALPVAANLHLRSDYPGTMRTSVQLGLILFFGNNPIEVNGHGNATPAVQRHVQALYAEDPSGAKARDEALAWIQANPGQALLNAPKKAYHLWLARPQGFTWHAQAGLPAGLPRPVARVLESAGWVQALAVLFLGIAGWRRLGPGRGFWTWTLTLHLAVWCLLASSTRNRYPLEPWLLLGAAGAVVARTRTAGAPSHAA